MERSNSSKLLAERKWDCVGLTTLFYGDANDNGEVEMADAVLILQYLADPSNSNVKLSDIGMIQADCCGNGIDAITIMKFKAHMIEVC